MKEKCKDIQKIYEIKKIKKKTTKDNTNNDIRQQKKKNYWNRSL